MGSIDEFARNSGLLKLITRFFLFSFIFIWGLPPLYSQNQNAGTNAVSLSSEISRLEGISGSSAQAAPSSRDRYDAFLGLARLHTLAGNHDAALNVYERALSAFPGDGRLLLEQGRLLLSIGEYERAGSAINALLAAGRDFLIPGRYLSAQLEAFSSGSTQTLAALADDPAFASYRSAIYYTLWVLTGQNVWKTRLTSEFPQSPEAKIAAAAQGVSSAATPHWLLYPGRESIVIASSPAQSPAPSTSPASASAATPPAPAVSTPPATPSVSAQPAAAAAQPAPAAGVFLQAGLFGSEANAQNRAEQMRRAGFDSLVIRRHVNGADFFAVGVSAAGDVNAMLRRLKDAGFESFPVGNP